VSLRHQTTKYRPNDGLPLSTSLARTYTEAGAMVVWKSIAMLRKAFCQPRVEWHLYFSFPAYLNVLRDNNITFKLLFKFSIPIKLIAFSCIYMVFVNDKEINVHLSQTTHSRVYIYTHIYTVSVLSCMCNCSISSYRCYRLGNEKLLKVT
jgi:hypothetical protein